MQTLEPAPLPRSSRPRLAWMAGGVAVVVVAAAISYAVGSSQTKTKTKTIVRTVAAAPAKAAPLDCVPGAAPGSCNVDEAKELAIPDQPLNTATRAVLAQQLVEARAAALRYPTVADALKAHMLQAGQFSPLTGAHYINIAAMVPRANVRFGAFDAADPQSLIYAGTHPTSRVIGVMYLSVSVLPPSGFAGPNDHWHRHTNTCVEYRGAKIVVPFAADSDVTPAMCSAKRGVFMRETAWMVHAWVVPGWESPTGVFSHEDPDLRCADGTVEANAVGFCKGT